MAVKRVPVTIGDLAYIPLTKGYVAVIDAADLPLVAHLNWSVINVRLGQPRARSGRDCLFMHRLIACPGPGQVVDHANGDTLDNRRANLRVCSYSQNSANSRRPTHNKSGIKGVGWMKSERKWRARIQVEGKDMHLGFFETKEEAAWAYFDAAKRHFGEFARQ